MVGRNCPTRLSLVFTESALSNVCFVYREDGMKMEVPFPVALKLYPKVFLPWFESYLNGEAAKEGCCRDDFLDENWEAKLRKSKENLGVDDMDVDPPEVSQTPLDVSVVSDTQPSNSVLYAKYHS